MSGLFDNYKTEVKTTRQRLSGPEVAEAILALTAGAEGLCDGVQPMCTNCSRGGTQFEDCEYPSSSRPSQVSILEDRIATVRDRIRVLEDPNQAEHIALHHPYVEPNPLEEQLALEVGEVHNSAPSSYSPSPPPSISISKDEWDIYFCAFSANSHNFGFFINPERLWQKSLLDELSDDNANISVALNEVVNLWNTRLSAPDPVNESTLLQNVLDNLSSDTAGRDSVKALKGIQAEVLVGYYFLYDGKVLQAAHHADAAFSLALASGFHQVRVPPSVGQNRQGLTTSPMQELKERIGGFWEAVALNSHCAMFLGLQAPIHRVQLADISTPWPSNQDHPVTSHGIVAERPLQAFLQGASVSGFSVTALYMKTVILLERVVTSHKDSGGENTLPWPEVLQLEGLLEALKGDLLLIEASPEYGSPAWLNHKKTITELLIHATMIRLHLPYLENDEQCRGKCLEAANAIGQAVASVADGDRPRHVEPTLGVIWSSACQVIACELIAGRRVNGQFTASVSSLSAISDLWGELSASSGLLLKHLTKCEETLGIKIKEVLAMANACV